jgi:hypothetical protein
MNAREALQTKKAFGSIKQDGFLVERRGMNGAPTVI